MNGDLSPTEIIRRLLASGYKVVGQNVKSPSAHGRQGSTVLTDHNGQRAVWILGTLYQKEEDCAGERMTHVNW